MEVLPLVLSRHGRPPFPFPYHRNLGHPHDSEEQSLRALRSPSSNLPQVLRTKSSLLVAVLPRLDFQKKSVLER